MVTIHKPSSPRIWLPGGNVITSRQRRETEARRQLAARLGIPFVEGGAADAWAIYDSFLEYLGDGTIDLDGDTFKIILLDSGYTPNTGTQDTYSDISGDELANGLGYTTGGETLSNVSWGQTSGTATFDADDVVWTASGGSIVARYAAIYDDTPSATPTDPLVCYSLLDNSPADVTATAGNTLTVAMNASGIFTLAEA